MSCDQVLRPLSRTILRAVAAPALYASTDASPLPPLLDAASEGGLATFAVGGLRTAGCVPVGNALLLTATRALVPHTATHLAVVSPLGGLGGDGSRWTTSSCSGASSSHASFRLCAVFPPLDSGRNLARGPANLPWQAVVSGVAWESSGARVEVAPMLATGSGGGDRGGHESIVAARGAHPSVVQPLRCTASTSKTGERGRLARRRGVVGTDEAQGLSAEAETDVARGLSEKGRTAVARCGTDSETAFQTPVALLRNASSALAYPFPILHVVSLPWNDPPLSGDAVVPSVSPLARIIVASDAALSRLFRRCRLARLPSSVIVGSPLPLRLVARIAPMPPDRATSGDRPRFPPLAPLLVVEGREAPDCVPGASFSPVSPDRFGTPELRIPALRRPSRSFASLFALFDRDAAAPARPSADQFDPVPDLGSSSLPLWRLGSPPPPSALLVSDPRRPPPDVSLTPDLVAWLFAGPLLRALPSLPALCAALLLLDADQGGRAARKEPLRLALVACVLFGGCVDLSASSSRDAVRSYGPLGSVPALLCLGAAWLVLRGVRSSARLVLSRRRRRPDTQPASPRVDSAPASARCRLLLSLACASAPLACAVAGVHPGFFFLGSLPAARVACRVLWLHSPAFPWFALPPALVALGRALPDPRAPTSLLDAVSHALLCLGLFALESDVEGRSRLRSSALFRATSACSCVAAFAAAAGAPWAAVPVLAAASAGRALAALVS